MNANDFLPTDRCRDMPAVPSHASEVMVVTLRARLLPRLLRAGAGLLICGATLVGGTTEIAARDRSRDALAHVTMAPPLPKPHPHRASPSRKASTARAAAIADAERAQASREADTAPATMPPPPPPPPPTATGGNAVNSQPAAPPSRRSDATRSETGRSASGPPAALSSAATAPQSTDSPAAADASTPPPPPAWTADEIEAATRDCDEILASTRAEAELQPPLRQGECGTPAPLKVSRIGSGDGIRLEPAGVLNCRMVARLHQWLETVAQPAAREAFGTKIAKLANASAYMCRNRYNDAAAKISDHAFANALDVSAFVLSDGRRIDVKTYWGPVAREAVTQPGRPAEIARRAVTAGLEAGKEKNSIEPAKPTPAVQAAPPQPAATEQAASAATAASAEQKFLRNIHDSACGIFTTVLGPEANAAHHDHFHLDLQKRRSSAYCQ